MCRRPNCQVHRAALCKRTSAATEGDVRGLRCLKVAGRKSMLERSQDDVSALSFMRGPGSSLNWFVVISKCKSNATERCSTVPMRFCVQDVRRPVILC